MVDSFAEVMIRVRVRVNRFGGKTWHKEHFLTGQIWTNVCPSVATVLHGDHKNLGKTSQTFVQTCTVNKSLT